MIGTSQTVHSSICLAVKTTQLGIGVAMLLNLTAMWSTRNNVDTTNDKDLYIKTTLKELLLYLIFLAVLCARKYATPFERTCTFAIYKSDFDASGQCTFFIRMYCSITRIDTVTKINTTTSSHNRDPNAFIYLTRPEFASELGVKRGAPVHDRADCVGFELVSCTLPVSHPCETSFGCWYLWLLYIATLLHSVIIYH